jgi:hypothetical protein
MHLQGWSDYCSSFAGMIDPMEDDDANVWSDHCSSFMAWSMEDDDANSRIDLCHGTAQIIGAQVQNTIPEVIKLSYLNPYNSGSPMKSRGILTQPTYKPRS